MFITIAAYLFLQIQSSPLIAQKVSAASTQTVHGRQPEKVICRVYYIPFPAETYSAVSSKSITKGSRIRDITRPEDLQRKFLRNWEQADRPPS